MDIIKKAARSIKRGLSDYVMYLDDMEVLRWKYKHSKRLSKFWNKHKGESCFIICNGPSLNDIDLERINKHHSFGLNKIYLIFERVKLDLSYHVCVNPYVIKQGFREMEGLDCPKFIAYKNIGQVNNYDEDVYFFMTGGRHFSFSEDITRPIHGGHTVTFSALQIAFFMGFNTVFLVGADHDYSASGEPNELQTYRGNDVNHFDSRYFKDQEWQLPDLEASELAYRLADYCYRRDKRKIYNATPGGKLEIFERIPFDKALEMCSPK